MKIRFSRFSATKHESQGEADREQFLPKQRSDVLIAIFGIFPGQNSSDK